MSFNGQYNQQVAQDYTSDNSGQYGQASTAASRQMSASSTTSGASNGAESNSTQLYMGDLDPNWTENDIKQIWASLGEPNVHVKLIKNSGSLCNSGYCFVEFPSNLAATNALLKMGLSIPLDPSRSLKLNWASFATAPGTEFSIFVGDLAPNVTESQLFELFISRYASTLNAKIVFDQATGVSKGYGFVKFGNEGEQQDSLVEMQGVFLNGRAIRVSTTSKNKSRFQTAGSGPAAAGAGTGATGVGASSNSGPIQSVGNQALLQQSQFIYPVQQQPSLSQFTDPNNTTVFIGGLSSLVTEEQLRAYFQPFGQIVYVKIPIGKGCGFVQYVDRSSAENAIAKMQGFPIGNSRIRLSWGRSAKQAAAMQQAFAVALQQFPQQQAQTYHHNQQHQLQQQSTQQSQKQVSPAPQSVAQPLLQQQLQQQFPYQQHPSFPQTYSFPVDNLNGTGSSYTPVAHAPPSHMTYQTTGLSDITNSSALLPNRSTLDFSGFSSATSNTSSFNFTPPASLGVGFPHQSLALDYTPGATQVTQTSGTPVSGQFTTHPHILVQGGEAYVKGRNSSLDRLEQGSNGYIFV